MKHYTRIAPSPTGMCHIGLLRTAYFNWLAAEATGGFMLLRIDDTDTERSRDEYTRDIVDTFNWAGITWPSVTLQSMGLDYYNYLISELIKAGFAVESEGCVRLTERVPIPDYWEDTVLGVIKTSEPDRDYIRNMVIRKSNGMPVYNFASIADDLQMGISWIIRGADHMRNTIKQLAIMEALRVIDPRIDSIKFSHIGLIEMIDLDSGKRRKISKRDKVSSVQYYRDMEIKPEALMQYVLRLGWGPRDPNFDKKHKKITKDEAIGLFLEHGNMVGRPSLLDEAKLQSINRKWA